jgi:biopolymer transport protein ExbB
LGMLEMFSTIAGQNTPVTPALLADGLWQALYTTVWGLLIAIPALAAGQGFALWAERYLEGVQALLNRCQLALDGLELELQGDQRAARWVLS